MHIDTHMDVLHASEARFTIYLDFAQRFTVPIGLPLQTPFPARELAAAPETLSADHLIYTWPRSTHDVVCETCLGRPRGVTELFAHPVLDDVELRGYDHHHAGTRVHDAAKPPILALRPCLNSM